jgi:hypothetical protein
MYKKLSLSLLFLMIWQAGFAQKKQAVTPVKLQKLSVPKDSRYIMQEDGKPFFWLGDTAWELFHRLTFAEAELYLQNRSEKGFNVIQSVALAEFDGLTQPDLQGQLPLISNDPGKPNEVYFAHVGKVIDRANQLGMYVGLVPTWGDKFNKKWGVGPEIFTPENAEKYGEYLGKKFRTKKIIWILGGDRSPENDLHIKIIQAMAKGIRKAVGDEQLISYHPMGGSYSSKYFHEEDWLNVNMFQSGHGEKDSKNYLMIRNDYNLKPPKPTLDGEPRYEDHPVNWKPELGYFNDFDSRQAAYWAVLSGACGHTYGCHDIWQFFNYDRNPPVSAARTHWKVAADLPGATQMGYMKKLFESYTWQNLVPDQSLIKNDNPEDAGYQIAAISKNKDLLIAYTPYGRTMKIDLTLLSPKSLTAFWFNPRDESKVKIGNMNNQGISEFKPYTAGPQTDWVLVIEDSTRAGQTRK